MKTLLTYQKLIVVLFAILFTLTFHGVSDAQTHIYIDAVNGANAPTGRGSAASPYKSITFALLISERNNLPDPWHVHIRPGNYNGDAAKGNAREVFPLKLRQEMIFEGTTTAEECIIDGQHTGDALVPILSGENTEGVTIRNLTIQNSLRTNGVGGIVLHDPTGTKETPSTFENCVVHNNKGGGVWSNMPLILTGNTFSNNGGSGVWNSKSTAAMDNTFSANGGGGLHIEGDSTGDITENIFQHNSPHGWFVKGTLEGAVTHNTFTNNRAGYGHSGGGFQVIGSLVGNITDNAFTGNHGYNGGGFYVSQMNGNVTNNTLTGHTVRTNSGSGFWIGGLTGNVVHNEFTDNSQGGFAIGNLTGNVSHNTFTRNSRNGGFEISTLVGKVTHNIFDSNSGDRHAGSGPSNFAGAFQLGSSTNTVEVFNNIFFNNTADGTGNSVVTKHATHFMNNLFMISDELSGGVRGAHTIWVDSPRCRFHNNIFSGVKAAIYINGSFDLPITHNLFHNVTVDFVEQAGNNLGNDLLFWELLAVNATDNLEGDPRLVDPVTTRDFHLQATSPAIDAGTNAFAPADDFDGVIRPVGAGVDIGPYEYGGTPIVVIDDPIVPDEPVGEPVDDTPPDSVVSDPTPDEPIIVVSDPTPDEPTIVVSRPLFPNDPSSQPPLKLYWAGYNKIQRGDLDGTNIENVVNRGAASIVLDATNGKIYWAAYNGIYRANLSDGTNIEQLIDGDITWGASGGGIALDVAGGKMYWANGNTNSIFRANLDGSNTEQILLLPNAIPLDIALDIAGGKMYWTQLDGNASISRANLDGTNAQPLINPGKHIQSIALDIAGGKMYWTEAFDEIGMANLDGSNIKTFKTETPDLVRGGITLDLFNDTVYWIETWETNEDSEEEGYSIQRSNLDGSQQRTIIESPGTEGLLYDIALYAPAVEPTPPVKTYPAWDVNEDGKTDVTDLVMVAAALGTSNPENPRLDVNGDGTVNIQDLILVATHLGEVAAAAAPMIVELPKHFTPETLQPVLDLLRTQNDGSLAFQRAIANLEQLLAALMPKGTELLANYPNPFNPETWIPYQLATPADVVLRIHAVDGSLVRTLSLGHKPVGIYQNRSRAAYWDGKNEFGEPIASGVYFYTLTADNFTATRKMLIRK